MMPREVNIVLTAAALRDPRMKRTDALEQADMAAAWAEDLADVALDDALAAVKAHYATSREPVMIADILALVGQTPVEDPWAHVHDVTPDIEAESRARALAAAGVTEDEWEAHKADPAWVAARFPRQIEAAPEGFRRDWL